MKYLYYIAAIFLVLSFAIAFALTKKESGSEDAAVIVNNRVITWAEFDKLYASRGHKVGRDDFIGELITKELLIQESQKEGIDKEEAFRMPIQNFYEQSLIKLLMDKKFSSARTAVSDEELKRYAGRLGDVFHLTVFSFKDPSATPPFAGGERMVMGFEELSGDLRQIVLAGKAGEVSKPVKMGDDYVAVRIDRVLEGETTALSVSESERLRTLLIQEKRERQLNEWVADLKKKAKIRVLDDRRRVES